MTEPTKEAAKPFGAYTAEDDAKFDAAAQEILSESPEKEPDFDLGEVAVRAAPEPAETESVVDEDALEEANEAYRRDGLSDEEISARLERLGHKRFIASGVKRSKKHRADDEAHSFLRRLRQEQEGNEGTTAPEKRERAQPASSLNLADVAAPLAERLGLDEEGKKALVASLDAAVKAKDGAIQVLEQNLGLVSGVLTDMLLDGARDVVGLNQVDDEDWFRVQETYRDLARSTSRHSGLSGKPRMIALLKDAARLEGIKAVEPEEIQRKASIASAKRNGAPVVARTRRLPEKPLSRDQIFDHMAKLVTQGRFKSDQEAAEYADRLRKQSAAK